MLKSVRKHLGKATGSYVAIGLVFGLLLAGLTTSGRVLCIGSQGHIEWELSAHGVCADLKSNVEHLDCQDGHDVYADQDHCGSCIDITLDTQILTNQRPSTKSDFQQTFASSWAIPALHSDRTAEAICIGPTVNDHPSAPPAMLCLRTVILLI